MLPSIPTALEMPRMEPVVRMDLLMHLELIQMIQIRSRLRWSEWRKKCKRSFKSAIETSNYYSNWLILKFRMSTKLPKTHIQQRTATRLLCPTAKESMLGPRGKTIWLTHNSTLLTLLKDTHIRRVERRIRRRIPLFSNLRHHLATTLHEMEDSGLIDGLTSHGREVTPIGANKVIIGLILKEIWTHNLSTKITLNLKRCLIQAEV